MSNLNSKPYSYVRFRDQWHKFKNDPKAFKLVKVKIREKTGSIRIRIMPIARTV